MPEERTQRVLSEIEFVKLLEYVLPRIMNARIMNPRLGHSRPDFIAELPSGRDAIIEAKGVTPNTRQRLQATIDQLSSYSTAYHRAYPGKESPELVLAVPGTFSPEHVEFLYNSGITRIIDGRILRAAGVDPEGRSALAEQEEAQDPESRELTQVLLESLDSIPSGRADWFRYQTLCSDILAFLLSPPLAQPISERSNWTRLNRRDLILPNYATEGFWAYMRTSYEAHYVVADAKNYVGNVKKREILQLANYLSAHGAGLFGVIISRNGGDRSAELTRREQWLLYRKMIIVLNDDDMRQMVSLRTSGNDPSDLIRQKIEDFRLDF